MQYNLADLHVHSFCSDGLPTPTQAVEEAEAAGVRALSLTDHDTVEGIDEATRAGQSLGVELIPGSELSAHVDEREVHLLTYFIDWKARTLVEFLSLMHRRRRERSEAMVARLNELGVDVTVEDVLQKAGTGVVGRPHVAAAMVDRGAVSDKEEAFVRYIGDRGPAAVPKPHTPVEQIISLVHDVGGVAVLAHPGASFPETELAQLAECGLDGVEVYHPSHHPTLIEHYTAAAERYGLLPSGGSDSHGEAEGPKIGDCGIGYEAIESLRERAAGYA